MVGLPVGGRIPQCNDTNKVLPLVPVGRLAYSAGVIGAMVFDFNGVIVDDETPHLLCFQQALAEAGLTLTTHDYYGAYLGMDERTCTRLLLEERDGVCDEARILRITDRKADLFRAHSAHHRPPLFTGAADFILAAKGCYRLAIASGGRRAQIEDALAGSAIEQAFEVMVCALVLSATLVSWFTQERRSCTCYGIDD